MSIHVGYGNLIQGVGIAVYLVEITTEGEIAPSYMKWHMLDYFSPTFPVILTEYIKPNFLRIVFTRNLTSPVWLSGPKMGSDCSSSWSFHTCYSPYQIIISATNALNETSNIGH